MSVCRTDALAAWRSEQIWCTREDLNLHAARAAASEAAASAVSPRVPIWCWLEDSNLPPLAYEASALPDELSQLLENRQKDRGAAPGVEATLWVRRGSAPRPYLDVHDVKERGATGAVVTGVRAHAPRTRTHARALWAHEVSLDLLRLVLRAICPPASAAEGGPCAGYSGFSLELCSDRANELGMPQ